MKNVGKEYKCVKEPYTEGHSEMDMRCYRWSWACWPPRWCSPPACPPWPAHCPCWAGWAPPDGHEGLRSGSWHCAGWSTSCSASPGRGQRVEREEVMLVRGIQSRCICGVNSLFHCSTSQVKFWDWTTPWLSRRNGCWRHEKIIKNCPTPKMRQYLPCESLWYSILFTVPGIFPSGRGQGELKRSLNISPVYIPAKSIWMVRWLCNSCV